MLDNLKEDASIQGEKDVLGGYILPSDIYDMVVELAYFGLSAGGANSVTMHFAGKNGENLRQTFWVTSGKAKGGTNYYTDKKGTRHYLPGFNQANSICKILTNTELAVLPTEPKIIKIWDSNLKKEAPIEKQVIIDLIGKEISLGVIHQVVDKQIKNEQGVYVPSGETREENEIDKIFRTSDHFTNAEILAEEKEAVFYDKWLDKNKGITRQKAKGATAQSVVKSGAPGGKTTESLFGDK